MTGYTECWVSVDGAADVALNIPDGPEAEAQYQAFAAEIERAALADGLPTELFSIQHGHEMDADDCGCVQYLTDHHPDRTWNMDDPRPSDQRGDQR